MASSKGNATDDTPQLIFTSPSFGPRRQNSAVAGAVESDSRLHRRLRRQPPSDVHVARRVRLEATSAPPKSPASSIYMGSYSQSPRRSRASLGDSVKTHGSSTPASPSASMSHSHLESLLQDLNLDLETYGVEELRDGFFDAAFFKPSKANHDDLMRDAKDTLPATFRKRHPLSPSNFLPKQWHETKSVLRAATTTRAGIKLTKSFLAFFIAYVLCLVPAIRIWLGRYSYIMVLSTILNHPGRTIGAQIDGAFLTIMGSGTGLGWGAFALWVSDSTSTARRGYGGILATFLVLFMGTIAALRSYYIRMYQFVLCAGIAIIYTCLADTSDHVGWRKLFSYGIPWLFGQALALLICCTIFPDAGARQLAAGLHSAFAVMQEGLHLPQPDSISLHRKLAWTFVNLSQVYRDLVLDTSVTRFHPTDVMSLRNLMQAVIRSLLSLKMETQLFDDLEHSRSQESKPTSPQLPLTSRSKAERTVGASLVAGSGEIGSNVPEVDSDVVVNIESPEHRPALRRIGTEERAVKLVADKLAEPTSALLCCMRTALARCDAVLMEIGRSKRVSSDILGALTKLRKTMIKYDEEDDSLMDNPALPPTYSNHPEVVELFLFVLPIRQAATCVENLLIKVIEMQQKHMRWNIYPPSYSFAKALQRTNATVRHDRGGVTAGFYFRSQTQLARTMRGMANIYKPLPRQQDPPTAKDPKLDVTRMDITGKYEEEEDVAMDHTSRVTKQQRFRYRLWVIVHRLQGFETRFALKVAIVTSLLSVPAWLDQSRGWWNDYESWWAVVMVWIMMHPRSVEVSMIHFFCGKYQLTFN